jgi:protein arginine kinase
MNWYLQTGKNSDVVLNSKIIYSRNLRNFKFGTDNLKEIQEIEDEVKSKIPSLGYNLKFLKMKDMDTITKEVLLEKGIVDGNALEDKNNNISILINDDENICIILNSQDHFEIQAFNSGMELESTFNLAKEIDDKFDKTFDIAKSKKYGYLTTSPINVGTGLKAATTVHLPGLTKTGNIRKISQTINNFGMNFWGLYVSNSSNIGDIYQISNKQTLGISEEDIINNLKIITDKIIEQEREARKILGKNHIELEDMVYRRYGILTNARKLKWQEAIELMSDVKLGVDMGLIKEIDDKKVTEIYFYINPANLQKYFGQSLDGYDRDIKRAEVIKQIINKK